MEVKVTEESTMEAKLAEVGARLDKLAKQVSEVKHSRSKRRRN